MGILGRPNSSSSLMEQVPDACARHSGADAMYPMGAYASREITKITAIAKYAVHPS